MAKQKGSNSVQNRHLYTRASYLYQAAQYLATQQPPLTSASPTGPSTQKQGTVPAKKHTDDGGEARQNVSRQLLRDMRTVTQKVLIRQSPDLKRTICKFCDTLQIEGQTSSSIIENASKGGRKPWADVLAIRCTTCGHVKRFPVSAARQRRRPFRTEVKEEVKRQETVPGAIT